MHGFPGRNGSTPAQWCESDSQAARTRFDCVLSARAQSHAASGCKTLAVHARAQQRMRIAPIQGLRCYITHTQEASIELAAHATYNSRAPQMESTLDHPTKA